MDLKETIEKYLKEGTYNLSVVGNKLIITTNRIIKTKLLKRLECFGFNLVVKGVVSSSYVPKNLYECENLHVTCSKDLGIRHLPKIQSLYVEGIYGGVVSLLDLIAKGNVCTLASVSLVKTVLEFKHIKIFSYSSLECTIVKSTGEPFSSLFIDNTILSNVRIEGFRNVNLIDVLNKDTNKVYVKDANTLCLLFSKEVSNSFFNYPLYLENVKELSLDNFNFTSSNSLKVETLNLYNSPSLLYENNDLLIQCNKLIYGNEEYTKETNNIQDLQDRVNIKIIELV